MPTRYTLPELRAHYDLLQTDMATLLGSVDMAEVCITSDLKIEASAPNSEAFTLEDPNLGVSFAKAEGEKCQRCWKILPDVGTHSHAGVCGRCDAALG